MLAVGVLFAAFAGFHLDRFEAVGGEVVGAGPHVQDAGGNGEFEGVGNQFRAGEGGEDEAEFIEVHGNMDAAGLVVLGAGLAGELEAVAGYGSGRKESEGVVMCATECCRFGDGVGFGRSESERDSVPGVLVLVNHGPFVPAEAAELGFAAAGLLQIVDGPVEKF